MQGDSQAETVCSELPCPAATLNRFEEGLKGSFGNFYWMSVSTLRGEACIKLSRAMPQTFRCLKAEAHSEPETLVLEFSLQLSLQGSP